MFQEIKYQELNTIYSSQLDLKRYNQLLSQFKAIYNISPAFIARAPGRVNIIGQHIDYEGYGVLPAAIQKDCLIAISTNQNYNIKINHINDKIYPLCQLPLKIDINYDFHNNYAKYFTAGYLTAIQDIPQQSLVGLNVLIEGNIPVASGVSSSSALCVCSCMAVRHVHHLNHSKDPQITINQFIQRIIKGQRLVGTASGGMDQSISVLGQANSCLYIQFNPIKAEKVKVPENCKFVIINSLVQSAKLDTAAFRYNKRVCQCRIVTQILALRLKIPQQKRSNFKILKDIQQWCSLSLHRMSFLVQKFLQRKPYSTDQIQQITGKKIEQLIGDIPKWDLVSQKNKTYNLFQAAKHVFDEADRVLNFIQICNSHLHDNQKAISLGQLMNDSQNSCSKLYECSCPQLDEITSLAINGGAYGSRLTGAGWGGCTVSLVQNQKVQYFIQFMKQNYLNKGQMKEKVQKVGIQNVIFVTKPVQGACIVNI